jgi:exopolysaccharide biosynthesis protein
MSKKIALLVVLVAVIVAGIGVGVYAATTNHSGTSVAAASTTLQSTSKTTTAKSVQTAARSTTTTAVASSDTAAASSEATATTASGTDTSSGGSSDYAATDTSYNSDTVSISISTVSTGSGQSKVTYYVADVQLKAGTLLQAGLAEGFQSGQVDYTSAIADANNAILAINGDYCTGRNTGVIIRNGTLYLDNPTRQGLALYTDGTMKVYDEMQVSAEQLLAGGVYNTYSFGPVLINNGVIPAGLDETEVEDIGEDHTILGKQPRTGIGIIDANHFVFVVVDGRSSGYSIGITLSQLAQIFKGLGCTTAYNLDGGGSSTMYFMGNLVNNPLGKEKERGISDILYVG